jgi:hypothetical protein
VDNNNNDKKTIQKKFSGGLWLLTISFAVFIDINRDFAILITSQYSFLDSVQLFLIVEDLGLVLLILLFSTRINSNHRRLLKLTLRRETEPPSELIDTLLDPKIKLNSLGILSPKPRFSHILCLKNAMNLYIHSTVYDQNQISKIMTNNYVEQKMALKRNVNSISVQSLSEIESELLSICNVEKVIEIGNQVKLLDYSAIPKHNKKEYLW